MLAAWGAVGVWLFGSVLVVRTVVLWIVARMLAPDEPSMSLVHSWWLTSLAVTGGVSLALLWPIFCIPLFLRHIHTVYV